MLVVVHENKITLANTNRTIFFIFPHRCARRPEARARHFNMWGLKLAANGRLPATLREPIRANPRHQARVCGASAMCPKRSERTRAERGRKRHRISSVFRGQAVRRRLYFLSSLTHLCAERPTGEAQRFTVFPQLLKSIH